MQAQFSRNGLDHHLEPCCAVYSHLPGVLGQAVTNRAVSSYSHLARDLCACCSSIDFVLLCQSCWLNTSRSPKHLHSGPSVRYNLGAQDSSSKHLSCICSSEGPRVQNSARSIAASTLSFCGLSSRNLGVNARNPRASILSWQDRACNSFGAGNRL